MAEVAGLALSGIALAGLFSTCVEFAEYLEQGKNWVTDLERSLTKMTLMVNRLAQWGVAMSINSPGGEAKMLRDRWPIEGAVIVDSLLNIRNILDTTIKMCKKYSYYTESGDCPSWLKKTNEHASQIYYPTSPPCGSLAKRRHSNYQSFRRKAAWVIQDKKKFDGLIADFDFFLKNLEKMGDNLPKESTISKPTIPPSSTSEERTSTSEEKTSPGKIHI